jgi:hypothetical protein
MRRCVLYLAVGLSAFGLGFGFVSLFVVGGGAPIARFVELQQIKIERKKADEIPPSEFKCEDRAAKVVWAELQKDADYARILNSFVEEEPVADCLQFFDRRRTDLNNDGISEVILKGNGFGSVLFCGSSGDCNMWIVSKINKEYGIIFEARAGEFSGGVEFLPEKTNKFKNIKVKQLHGWSADTIGIFKFDGKRYQIKKCLEDVNSEYEYDDVRVEKWIPIKPDECL